MTITSHAAILYTSSSVYLIAFAIVTNKHIPAYCKAGIILYLIGAYFMISDPFAIKTTQSTPSLTGDFICFISAGLGAGSITVMSMFPKDIPPLTRNCGLFFFGTLSQSLVLPFQTGFSTYYSFEEGVGGFAWITSFKTFMITTFVVALFSGIIGNVIFIVCFKYFSADIIASFILLEPVFGQIAGILLGQDNIPGLRTLIGGVIITAGFVLSGFGEKEKVTISLQKPKSKSDYSQNELEEL